MYTLSEEEKIKFLGERTNKPQYKFKEHSFKTNKHIGKKVCSGCGLVALNNPISKWCIQKGCNFDDHTQYTKKVKNLTKVR